VTAKPLATGVAAVPVINAVFPTVTSIAPDAFTAATNHPEPEAGAVASAC
jgi:hypothetical protein